MDKRNQGPAKFVEVSEYGAGKQNAWAIASGFVGASVFSSMYYIAPTVMIASIVLSLWYLFECMVSGFVAPSTWTLVFTVPFYTSMLLPRFSLPGAMAVWPFKHVPAYFNYTEVREFSVEEGLSMMKRRPLIGACHPHGVFSFGGLASAVASLGSWYEPENMPLAAATSVLATPILKHLLGIFSLVPASRSSLRQVIGRERRSVVLYPGGIAELFASHPEEEILYARKRRGHIKMALTSGADILPVYFIGNTRTLVLLNNGLLRFLARATGISLTVFWGAKLFGFIPTPCPSREKIVGVFGKPLGMPMLDMEQYPEGLRPMATIRCVCFERRDVLPCP